MNNTKRALIITAIILNILNIGLNIYLIVSYFMLPSIDDKHRLFDLFNRRRRKVLPKEIWFLYDFRYDWADIKFVLCFNDNPYYHNVYLRYGLD